MTYSFSRLVLSLCLLLLAGGADARRLDAPKARTISRVAGQSASAIAKHAAAAAAAAAKRERRLRMEAEAEALRESNSDAEMAGCCIGAISAGAVTCM